MFVKVSLCPLFVEGPFESSNPPLSAITVRATPGKKEHNPRAKRKAVKLSFLREEDYAIYSGFGLNISTCMGG